MSSAMNTPVGRKRPYDDSEYEYVPRTPGTIFPMDLGPHQTFGASFFEPPMYPAQALPRPSPGCLFGQVCDLNVNNFPHWPQDMLQDQYLRHDSNFGNTALYRNGFEAPGLNYIFAERTANKTQHGPYSSYSIGHEPDKVNGMNSTSGEIQPAVESSHASKLPAKNITAWVASSSNASMLPPEITIDSPSNYIPPSSQFPDPRSLPQPESRLNRNIITTDTRGREYAYNWGSHASSSSESFQTPPSSLSTNDGRFDFGSHNSSAKMPPRTHRNSVSTTASSFGTSASSSALQFAVSTPQSSSIDSWSGSRHKPSGISVLTTGLRNEQLDQSNLQDDCGSHVLSTPSPVPSNLKPRMVPLILPAPANKYGPVAPQSFQDCITTSRQASDRRILTSKGRENAKAVRDMGACLLCHFNKTKCSPFPGKPCENCQKLIRRREHTLENKELMTGICIRIDLRHYRLEISDLYDIANRTYDIPLKLDAWSRTIIIGHCIRTGGKKYAYFPIDMRLSIDVQDCEFIGHGFGRNTKWEEDSKRMSSYRIEDSTLPTPDYLDKWGRNLMAEFSTRVPDFEPSIRDKFLFDYCNIKPLLPLHKLVDLTIRMVSLGLWLQGTHPVVELVDLNSASDLNPASPLIIMSDISIHPMLSPIARGQLRSIAAKAMEETEKEILEIFDEAIKNPPKDTIIIGLCLWRLALLYRMMMKRYKVILYDACVDRRREKQKAMYEAMTTGYSLVYRGTVSPYSPAWCIERHLHSFHGYDHLRHTFLHLKDVDKKFYDDNINDDDDVHARKLLWERMAKCTRRMRGRT